MKKVVVFTLAMVLAFSCAAFAFADDNDTVPVAAALGFATDANAAAADGNVAQQAFQVNTDVKTDDILSNNKVAVATDNGQVAGAVAAKDDAQVGTNFDNIYVVDNAILANVNVKDDSFFGSQNGRNSFFKSQHAEVGGSFNFASGVSNVNSAAGNLNSQSAATSIGVAFVK